MIHAPRKPNTGTVRYHRDRWWAYGPKRMGTPRINEDGYDTRRQAARALEQWLRDHGRAEGRANEEVRGAGDGLGGR